MTPSLVLFCCLASAIYGAIATLVVIALCITRSANSNGRCAGCPGPARSADVLPSPDAQRALSRQWLLDDLEAADCALRRLTPIPRRPRGAPWQ